MKIQAEIPYQALLELNENSCQVIGPQSLMQKILDLKKAHGPDPRKWVSVKPLNGEDILINEFILKCQEKYKLIYNHDELCHCRMVPTEKVISAIKQNCHTVGEVARTTMAGTGCGSCKKDTEALIGELMLNQKAG